MQLRNDLFLFCFAILVGMEEFSVFLKKGQLLSIFNRCGPFRQYFGLVVAQVILSLVKIVRVCCIVACSMLSVLLCNRV